LRLFGQQGSVRSNPGGTGFWRGAVSHRIRARAIEACGQVMVSGFERDVEAHIPALRRYARALQGDADRAEDLLQDSLERALSRPLLFVSSQNLRGWLFR